MLKRRGLPPFETRQRKQRGREVACRDACPGAHRFGDGQPDQGAGYRHRCHPERHAVDQYGEVFRHRPERPVEGRIEAEGQAVAPHGRVHKGGRTARSQTRGGRRRADGRRRLVRPAIVSPDTRQSVRQTVAEPRFGAVALQVVEERRSAAVAESAARERRPGRAMTEQATDHPGVDPSEVVVADGAPPAGVAGAIGKLALVVEFHATLPRVAAVGQARRQQGRRVLRLAGHPLDRRRRRTFETVSQRRHPHLVGRLGHQTRQGG